MEDIHFDPDSGQLVSGSFMDYAMPRADDVSGLAIHSNPVPTKTNPLGVKGCGEAGCVGAMPAVANAVVDALSVYGIRHIEMPATPERVWRAIKEANKQVAE
jgi:carbon-monoxide dehydrogenase large subunit